MKGGGSVWQLIRAEAVWGQRCRHLDSQDRELNRPEVEEAQAVCQQGEHTERPRLYELLLRRCDRGRIGKTGEEWLRLDSAFRDSHPIMMRKAMQFLPGRSVLKTPPKALDQEAKEAGQNQQWT